jgi:hypothetical protein
MVSIVPCPTSVKCTRLWRLKELSFNKGGDCWCNTLRKLKFERWHTFKIGSKVQGFIEGIGTWGRWWDTRADRAFWTTVIDWGLEDDIVCEDCWRFFAFFTLNFLRKLFLHFHFLKYSREDCTAVTCFHDGFRLFLKFESEVLERQRFIINIYAFV